MEAKGGGVTQQLNKTKWDSVSFGLLINETKRYLVWASPMVFFPSPETKKIYYVRITAADIYKGQTNKLHKNTRKTPIQSIDNNR